FVKRIQIKESVDETDVIQLKERVKALEQAKFGFDEIQNTIEISVDDNELENQFAIRAEFEDEYFSQVALAKKIIFNNDHNDDNQISAANYEVAWSALLERYDNNKLLIHNHVKALFNSEPIHKETANGLRKLIDDFSKNLRALEQLQQPVGEWDTLLVYLVSIKLDSVTLREWENSKSEIESSKFQDIKTFLNSRADMFEMVAQNQTEKRKGFNANTRGFLTTGTSDNRECVICGESHYVQNCKSFLKMSTNEREKKARSLRLCLNCLKKGHHSKVCRRGTCTKCNEKHHTLLHRYQGTLSNAEQSANLNATPNANASAESVVSAVASSEERSVVLSACSSVDHVLLSTAYVQVTDSNGNTHTVRALLDSGAQSSFVTKGLCQRLNLKTRKVNISVKGLSNIASNINSKCEMTIQSLYNNYSATKCFFVIDIIAGNIPEVRIDASRIATPHHINLADPTFYKPDRIDILLGSDLFWELICVGQISLGPNNPILQKTKLGWVVSGPIGVKPKTLMSSVIWWKGPPFLIQDKANWPDQPLNSEVLSDVRKGKRDIFVSIEMQESIIKRYSDLNGLKRIVAYLMRFSHNCKFKCEGRANSSPELSLAEVDHAMMRLIQMSQAEYFHLEIESLKKGKTFNGKVVNLNPFIDSDAFVANKKHIWDRWSKEYVNELQQRTKWKVHHDSLKLGSLVLVKEDNQPPMRWKLGRVEAIHAGRDGVVRVATLKTNSGFIKRSFAKICPLPVDVIPETE
ncbi:hypothetical protein NQ318_004892, partial [Aromia moschata]